MKNVKKLEICNGVNFLSIKDTRFKTTRISVTMILPLSPETASINAIIPLILSRSCKDYPSLVKMNEKLSELYGAKISQSVNKVGDNQALTISITGINDEYSLNEKKVSENITKLLCSILFNPNLENNEFNKEDTEQEKRQLTELIDSEFNDKRIYSKLRCEELMCANEKFGTNRFGTKKQISSLTGKDIYKAWNNIIKTSQIEIIMIGNSDYKATFEIFSKELSLLKRNFSPLAQTEIIKSSDKVNEYKDKMEVSQCKLVMGFRSGIASPDNKVNAARVMNALFGGTPHSKLFLNVREKMSLCYYCIAKYDKFKGIIMVESGVEEENIEKTKNEILNQLESIKNGDFDITDISSTKLSLSNYYKSLSDSLKSLENFYISQIFDNNILTPEQQAEQINNVTKEDIINAAKKVSLDTIYVLDKND